MESEKIKKKRNKKKNNKQNKALDQVEDNQNQSTFEVKDVRNHVTESHGSCSNATDCTIRAESETQQLLQKEATLEDTIRKLQTEKDFYIQKQATLEDTVNQLTKENDLHLQKECDFEVAIKQLRDEKNSYIQKESVFEDAIKQLRDEKSLYIQKEADLEIKISQLQRENDSLVQKENQLEERISQLVDEKITLDLKELSLEERVKLLEEEKYSWFLKELSLEERVKLLEEEKYSWFLKEDSNRVSIANLSGDIAGLRVQVLELEEARNNLLHENQQLTEYVSSLQFQIESIQGIASVQSSDELTKLASERDELNSQVESAFGLVERLVEENAELVEKVSELLIQRDPHGGSVGQRSTAAPDLVVGTDIGHEPNSIEIVVPLTNGIHNTGDYYSGDVLPESSIPSEIVPVPMDENDTSDPELLIVENEDMDATPLSDAPLIGAPFRLISFVSRYVSGADLVEKNSL